MSRLRLILFTVVVGGLLLIKYQPRHEARCHPYHSYGHLDVDERDANANRWRAFEPDCDGPALFAGLFRAVWRGKQVPDTPVTDISGVDFVEEELDPDGKPWDDMEWLRGRTVLYIGDSLARNKLIDFCKMLYGYHETFVHPDDPYYPYGSEEPMHVGDRLDLRPKSQEFVKRAVRTDHEPHYCYVPELDFMYMNVFTFGLDEHGYFIGNEESVTGPYRYEQRVEYVAKRVMDQVQKKLGRKKGPDLIFLISGFWDNTRWMREEIAENITPPITVSAQRLEWYRKRIQSVVATTAAQFPGSPLRWVLNPFPVNTIPSQWFYGSGAAKGSAEVVLARMYRLNQAVRSAISNIRGIDVDVMQWGDMIVGMKGSKPDDIHPQTFPSNYVWADMMLYELKRSLGKY